MTKRHCFVLMPFTVKEVDRPRYEDPNHWSEVYEGLIAPALKDASLSYERDDRDSGSRLIVDGILRKIERADLILCDLSSHNPNVFLELGWALRADKPYLLIKDDLTTYTFDLGQQYTLEYDHRLQPIVLAGNREKLAAAVTMTLDDRERRYSVVRSLAVTSVAMDAADKGEYQTQILLDIQRRLVDGIDRPRRLTDPTDQFPWPNLLRRALNVLFAIFNDPAVSNAATAGLNSAVRDRALQLGVVGEKEIQVTVINDERTFMYHDWGHLVGKRATHTGLDGIDIYDEVLKHPMGAVAWVDRATNVLGRPDLPTWRYNVALFLTLKGCDWRIVVEAHHEIC